MLTEQGPHPNLHDKLTTYHDVVIALRYVILVHVAAAIFAICWLAGAGVAWGAVAALAVIGLGIYLIGPFEADSRRLPLADPPFDRTQP